MTNRKSLLICLDYDDTYTASPVFWAEFIALTQKHGHQIIVATMRHEIEGKEIELKLGRKVDRIIYTNRKAKKPFLYSLGVEPDIWIDDTPEYLLNNAI